MKIDFKLVIILILGLWLIIILSQDKPPVVNYKKLQDSLELVLEQERKLTSESKKRQDSLIQINQSLKEESDVLNIKVKELNVSLNTIKGKYKNLTDDSLRNAMINEFREAEGYEENN